jgi:uncharacterized SAM-binding protein YcdF (DUF218 family)
MHEIYTVMKAMMDPLFIVFVLLCFSFAVFVRSVKSKADSLVLFLGIVLLYAAGIAPVSNYLCYSLEKGYMNEHEPKDGTVDAVVVLGHGTHEVHPLKRTLNSDVGCLRVLRAVEVYRQSGEPILVFCGRGEGDVSEAQAMAVLAQNLGVAREKIKMEAGSENTAENAREASKIIGGKNIRLGLVTSAFHMKRSEREFKKYFKNVVPLPAHYLYASPGKTPVVRYMPQSRELYKTALAVREIIALGWYAVKS